MRSYLVSTAPRAVLFDIDNTLYRDDRYAQWQIDVLIQRFASHEGLPLPTATKRIADTRSLITAETGRRPSLGNTMARLGVPMTQSIAWREELIEPERFLRRDAAVVETLGLLARSFRIAALTNNPESVGRRTLKVIGCQDMVPVVVGLDTTGRSKPDWAPFAAALARLEVGPPETVMVGDRYDVDLAPFIDAGGGGVLVESRADLLELPTVLREYR
jgi:FMN phosphatase YigB (HAD superfamily)